MKRVAVSGGFDDLRSRDVRFLERAAGYGSLIVLLWSDRLIAAQAGHPPRFPFAERHYLLESLRFVSQVVPVDQLASGGRPEEVPIQPDALLVDGAQDNSSLRQACLERGIDYAVIREEDLAGFPVPAPNSPGFAGRKKVVVTGCFDWLHSGHVRFFEEASQLGDLYVVVGSDANVRLLKGEGHPLFGQAERRYMVAAVKYVKQALISSGHGWMDAEPEVDLLKPDIYAVNQDGDKPEKREFCAAHGLEYAVLKRVPKEGLPRRESSILRGF